VPASGKLESIQALRAIAAMLVVLFHAQQAFALRFAEPAFASESYLFAFGAVGVHLFFVISGFIMVYTNQTDRSFELHVFLWRRFQRIYPIYWICCILYLACRWLLDLPSALSGTKIAGALLLMPGSAAAIIGPAWTLAFEVFFYISFGLALTWGVTRGLVILAASFTALIVLGVFFPFESAAWDLVTNALLIEFVAGAMIGWCFVNGWFPKSGGWIFVLVALILFALGIWWGYDRLPSLIVWGPPSALLVAGALMLEVARGAGSSMLKLARFGDSSYALYLIHILVIMVFVALGETFAVLARIEPAVASLPVAIVALVFAELLHHRVERPLLRKLPSSLPFFMRYARKERL